MVLKELDIFRFWAFRDRTDWIANCITRRRNCWYVCKYGNPGVSIDEVMTWPISKLRLACSDVGFWLDMEKKNSKVQ